MSLWFYHKFLPVWSLFLFLFHFSFIVPAVPLCLYTVSHFSDNCSFIKISISDKASFPSLIFMFWLFFPFSYFFWFYRLEIMPTLQFSSVSQLCLTLWSHGLQHTRPPCSLQTSGVYSNSCPLSWICHRGISSSLVPFSSCPQSFPGSGFFQISQFFTSGGQMIGVSPSASVLPMNIQGWLHLGWTG